MNLEKALSTKTLVMLVGPSAIGKSTLMNEIIRERDDFAYVRSFTTRAPREGEQSHYSFIGAKEAQALRATNRAITYFEHPTTHDVYGTTEKSYPGTFNLLDTLSGSVADYRKLPFKRTITIAITAPADEWRHWFLSRYSESTPEAEKRLKEATLSINWALNDPEVYWINNNEGALMKTAEAVIATATSPLAQHTTPPKEPYAMLELIKEGVWR